MPGYGGTGRAGLLDYNQQAYLFQHELNIAGRPSIAFQLKRVSRSFYPWGVSFQIYFTDINGNPADPGAFEVDIQTSDIDEDSQYGTVSSWPTNGVLNANFVGRIELLGVYAKYVRALVVSITNPVFVTVLATH